MPYPRYFLPWSRISRAVRVAVVALMLAPAHGWAETPKAELAAGGPNVKQVQQGIVPLALPTYAPETRWAVGAALVYYRRPEPEGPPATNVKLGVVGTQRRQFSLSLVADQYITRRAGRVTLTAAARRFPDLFWDVGPSSPDASRREYRRDEVRLETALLWCPQRGLCAGPAARIERIGIEVTDEGRPLGSSKVAAWAGGAQLEWDSRDAVFYPRAGGLIVLKASVGRVASDGATSTLGRLDLDGRRFFRLGGEHVLAAQVVGQVRLGRTPFPLMPTLGGDSLLRGHYQGRYRDVDLIAAQIEYRFPLIWRLGGVCFVGAGVVGPDLRSLTSGPVRAAGGPGLRLALDRDERINLRLDVAGTPSGAASGYLSITEAF